MTGGSTPPPPSTQETEQGRADYIAAREEYPPHVWTRFYAIVLGVLVLDIAVFAFLTRYFS